MHAVTTIGLDIAKSVFQIHGVDAAGKAIAPMWQPGAYIRSCELSSVVERTHSNVARKTKGWLEHEIHHAAENSRGIIEVPAARVDAAGQSPRLRRAGALTWPDKARTRTASGRKERQLQSFGDHVLIRC